MTTSATQTTSTPPRPSKKTTVTELKGMLGTAGLETKGKRETLWRRLLNHFKKSHPSPSSPSPIEEKLSTSPSPTEPTPTPNAQTPSPTTKKRERNISASPSVKKRGRQPIRAFLCFDVEATCRGGKEFDWPNEIIEFPVVLLRWEEDVLSESQTKLDPAAPPRLVIVDKFHSYVRPTWTPVLSEFCTSFTGITQEMVDASPTFPEVLKKLEAWMDSHKLRELGDGQVVEGLVNAVWVTDGPWDLRDFIPKQLHITPTSPASPLYLRQPYLNLKQAFQTVLSEEYRREQYALCHPGEAPNERSLSRITTGKLVGRPMQEKYKGLGFYLTITGMLEKLGLGEFEGRQHCGLDDATNVARILQKLVEKDILVETNGRLPPPRNSKKWAWMGDKPGDVHWEEWMSDNKRPLEERAADPGGGGAKVGAEAGATEGDGGKGAGKEVKHQGVQTGGAEREVLARQPVQSTEGSAGRSEEGAGGQGEKNVEEELVEGIRKVDLGLGEVVKSEQKAA